MELHNCAAILVLLTLTGPCAGQLIVSPPSPATGILGSTAQFSCEVDFVTTNEYIEWLWGTTTIYYYNNGDIVYPQGEEKYQVEKDANTFVLTIKDLDYSDATQLYACNVNTKDPEPSQLVVLATPTVEAVTPDREEGKEATYSCKANFGGPDRTAIGDSHFPSIKMFLDGLERTGTDTEQPPDETNNFYILSREVNITLQSNMNERYMVCEIQTAIPDVRESGNVTMDVHFPVTVPTYTPNEGSYAVGDVITCQADGNPVVGYNWEDTMSDSQFNGPELTITEDMPETNIWLCKVENTVSGVPYTEEVSAEFNVVQGNPEEETGAENWKIAVGVAVPICILIIGAIVGLVVYTLVLKKKPQKQNSNIPMNNSMDGSGRNGRFGENPGYKDTMDEEKMPPITLHSPNRYQNAPNLPFNGNGTPPPNYKYQADLLGTGLGSNMSLPLDDTTDVVFAKPTPTKRSGSQELLGQPIREPQVSFDENARDYDDEEDDDNDSMPRSPPPELPSNGNQFRPALMPANLPPPDTMV